LALASQHFVCTCIGTGLAFTQGMSDPGTIPRVPDHEVLLREREWLLALQHRDQASLDDILDNDFTLISWASGGEKLSKSEYLEDFTRVELTSFEIHDCQTQVYESAAVVRCRLEWKARVGERLWDAEFLITDMWILRNGRWRVVARHASLPCPGDRRTRATGESSA
jgi:hypothetical protein